MRKQQGITLIGMLMTMVVVIMAAVVVMRIVPVVIEYYSIVSSIKSLNETPESTLSGDPMTDVEVLRQDLLRRLDINGIQDLKNNQVIFTPNGDKRYRARLKYQAIRPLIFNVSLMFSFDRTIEVIIGGEK